MPMKSIFVTIVDILGVFVPGLLLLIGLLLLPWIFNDLISQGVTWESFSKFIQANGVALAIIVAITAYVLGFLLRLWSVRLLEALTRFRWATKLKMRATIFHEALESAIGDPKLCEALNNMSASHGKSDLSSYAPYFHFAKRVVRSSNPASWAEAERMEAEIRFAAGLFIPFCILLFDGFFLRKPLGYVISIISLVGAVVIWSRFPSRRIKEVLIDYLLAIVVLRYKPKSVTADKDE